MPWTWAPERRRRVALKGLRALGVVLAIVLVTWGVLWLAVPPLLKWQAQDRLSTLLGRTVTIGTVQFAPWSLQLTLRDLTVAGADGQRRRRSAAAASWIVSMPTPTGARCCGSPR